jgi:hypothetical protein
MMTFFFRYRLPLAIVLLTGCFFLLYPWYQYVLDDDGIGYAMVTKRLAAGDYYHALNGYWSPLHSWLALPFYKAGADLPDAFKLSNLLISGCLLYVLDRLMKYPELNYRKRLLLLITVIPILLYMSFYQLAADILFCLLFCWYLLLSAGATAFNKITTVIACSVVGVLAYLAKAYAFPLFVAHFTVWQCWLYKRSLLPERKKQLIKNLLIGIGLFLILSLPWIIALHGKYDRWTFGYSGKVNLAWQLAPEKTISPDTSFFSAPPYPQSPTAWEDPGYPHQDRVSPFESFNVFLKQLKLVLHNIIAALQSFHELSFLASGIILGLFLFVMRTGSSVMLLFLLSVLLLPGGYLPVHIEPRFLWPAALLLLIAGSYLLTRIFTIWRFRRAAHRIAWAILIGSFLITPLNALQDLRYTNKTEHTLAATLQADGISGKFASDVSLFSPMRKIAFLSGNQYYENHRPQSTFEEVAVAIEKENIDYYFFFHEIPVDVFRNSALYRKASRKRDYPQFNLIVLDMR